MKEEDQIEWGNRGDEEFERLSKITIGSINRSVSISEANLNRMTEETRKKVSESHKGKKMPENHGKKISEWHKTEGFSKEAREKMSIASKSKIIGEETRKKLSDNMMGKPKTEEAREKMSLAKKGKKLSEEHKEKLTESRRKPYAIYNGKTYTLFDLSQELGIDRQKISRIKNGREENYPGIEFIEMERKNVSTETSKKISEAKKKSEEEKNKKPYAIYDGITYNIIELTEKLEFPNNFRKIKHVKNGKSKNIWGLIFL